LRACAAVGLVKDRAAIAPASATPFPIRPKRPVAETIISFCISFVVMALSILGGHKVRYAGYWLAPLDRHAGKSTATPPHISVMFQDRSSPAFTP
jgi:hypothetical protein